LYSDRFSEKAPLRGIIHLKASAEGVALNPGVEGFHIMRVKRY
jgi:hypothetical protein